MTPFAKWLEDQLTERKLARTQLATFIGKRAQTIYSWYNEGRTPQPEMLRLITQYFAKGDLERYGVLLACGWTLDEHPDSLDNVFEFTGAEGALADPWGVGTIGNLDTAGEVQFGTVYDNKSGVTHTGLEQSSGDGWVCYRSVP